MSEHIKSKLNITSLSKPYVSVNGSFGGDQSWLEKAEGTRKGNVLKNYGCGLIAASDILMYLMGGMEHVINPTGEKSMSSYEDYILTMERKYFRILPILGISGVLLAWNLNMYFLLHRTRSRRSDRYISSSGLCFRVKPGFQCLILLKH